MQKISKKEYQNKTFYLREYLAQKKQRNDRILFLNNVDLTIDECGEYVYVVDYREGNAKFYKCLSDNFIRIYNAMRELYFRDVSIKLNSTDETIYVDFSNGCFLYETVELTFSQLRDLHVNITKAKNNCSKK